MAGSDEIHDPVLGTLAQSDEPGCWEGTVGILDVEVDIVIDIPDNESQVGTLVEFAKEVVLFVQGNELRVRETAVNELLPEVNRRWPDNERLSAAAFRDSLELESIHFSLEQYEKCPGAQVNYQCTELLEGWPVVHIGPDMTIRYASLDIS